MFLKNRNISSKIKRSKVTEYAALSGHIKKEDQVSLNAGQKYSAILLTFIKLQFVIKIFVLSIFEWSFKTCFTVLIIYMYFLFCEVRRLTVR